MVALVDLEGLARGEAVAGVVADLFAVDRDHFGVEGAGGADIRQVLVVQPIDPGGGHLGGR